MSLAEQALTDLSTHHESGEVWPASFDALTAALTATGWNVAITPGRDVGGSIATLHATRPDGTGLAVQAASRRAHKAAPLLWPLRKQRCYIQLPNGKWGRIRPLAAFADYIEDPRKFPVISLLGGNPFGTPADATEPEAPCDCGKTAHHTEQAAKRAAFEVMVGKGVRGRQHGVRGGVYRCPANPALWHITRLSKDRPQKGQPA